MYTMIRFYYVCGRIWFVIKLTSILIWKTGVRINPIDNYRMARWLDECIEFNVRNKHQ